jgi:hypothetical protein
MQCISILRGGGGTNFIVQGEALVITHVSLVANCPGPAYQVFLQLPRDDVRILAHCLLDVLYHVLGVCGTVLVTLERTKQSGKSMSAESRQFLMARTLIMPECLQETKPVHADHLFLAIVSWLRIVPPWLALQYYM